MNVTVESPGTDFPTATFFVNTVGCLMLGALLVLVVESWPPSEFARPFLAIGFIGSYTTFSSVVVEVVLLERGDRPGVAAAYLVLTVVAGLVATVLGMALGWRAARR